MTQRQWGHGYHTGYQEAQQEVQAQTPPVVTTKTPKPPKTEKPWYVKIREWREKHGITKSAMALQLKTDHSRITTLEKGVAPFDCTTGQKLVAAYKKITKIEIPLRPCSTEKQRKFYEKQGCKTDLAKLDPPDTYDALQSRKEHLEERVFLLSEQIESIQRDSQLEELRLEVARLELEERRLSAMLAGMLAVIPKPVEKEMRAN